MSIEKLLDAVTTTVASGVYHPQDANKVIIHIDISAAGTSASVEVKGRVDSSMPYFVMATKTASDIFEISGVSDVIIEVAAVDGKTISAAIKTIKN